MLYRIIYTVRVVMASLALSPYMGWFGITALVCAGVYYRSWSSSTIRNIEFSGFQRMFFVVYLTMMMADWMQGPYVYALYDHYGFSKGQSEWGCSVVWESGVAIPGIPACSRAAVHRGVRLLYDIWHDRWGLC